MSDNYIVEVYTGKWLIPGIDNEIEGRFQIHSNRALVLILVCDKYIEKKIKSFANTVASGISEGDRIELYGAEYFSSSVHKTGFSSRQVILKIKYALFDYNFKEFAESLDEQSNILVMHSNFYSHWVDDRYIQWGNNENVPFVHDEDLVYEFTLEEHDLIVSISSGFYHNLDFDKANIEKISRIALIFSKNENFSNMMKIADRFNELLYLLTSYRVYPNFSIEADFGGHIHKRIISWTGKEDKTARNYSSYISFKYSEITDIFPSVLSNWLKKYDDLQHLISLQSSLIWRNEVPVRDGFLMLAQLIEGWQDSIDDGDIISKSAYKKFRKATEEFIDGLDIDPLVKSNMKNGIIASYKYSFRDKLDKFINFNFYQLLDRQDSREDFIERVKTTRNYFTHLDNRYISRKFSESELLRVNHSLAKMLRWHMLESLGVSQDRIAELGDKGW